jgi:hypothetical protein
MDLQSHGCQFSYNGINKQYGRIWPFLRRYRTLHNQPAGDQQGTQKDNDGEGKFPQHW